MKPLVKQVRSKVWNEVWDQVKSQVRVQVCGQVGDQLWEVRDSLSDLVESRVLFQLRDQEA